MIVKVGDQYHKDTEQPVMVILTDEDKKNISNMDPKAFLYCSYPDHMDPDEIREWMDDFYTAYENKDEEGN